MSSANYKILIVEFDPSTSKANQETPFKVMEDNVNKAIEEGYAPCGSIQLINNGHLSAYDGIAPSQLLQPVIKIENRQASNITTLLPDAQNMLNMVGTFNEINSSLKQCEDYLDPEEMEIAKIKASVAEKTMRDFINYGNSILQSFEP